MYGGCFYAKRQIVQPRIISMKFEGSDKDGRGTSVRSIRCTEAGRHGFVVRVLPCHDDLATSHDARLIRWA